MPLGLVNLIQTPLPVSYTHLDVYKRQPIAISRKNPAGDRLLSY